MRKFLLVFLFLLPLVAVYAQQVFVIDSIKEEYQLNAENILIYEDRTNTLSIQEVSKKNFLSLKQLPRDKRKPSYTYWFKQAIINKTDQDLSLIFLPFITRFDSLEVFISTKSTAFIKSFEKLIYPKYISLHYDTPHCKILFKKNQPIYIYAKINSRVSELGYVGLFKTELSFINNELHYFHYRVATYPFYAIAWVIAVFCIISYFVLKNKAFLFYALYISFLFLPYTTDMLSVVIHPSFKEIGGGTTFLSLLAPHFYLNFIRLFVNTSAIIPKLDKIIVKWLYLVLILSPFFILDIYIFGLHLYIVNTMLFISLLIIYLISFILTFYFRKSRIITFFTLGNLLVIFIPIFNQLSFRTNPVPIYEIGMVGQIIVFFIGLAYHLKSSEDEKRKIQEENIKLQQEISQQLEEKNEELAIQNELITSERQKSEQLLLNILPAEVAEELKEKGYTEVKHYENTSVLFADVKGFSTLASKVSPQELIKELDATFSQMDKIIAQYNLERIKTIGDCYMCAGGVPHRNTTNPIDITLAALAIQNWMFEERQRRNGDFWQVRLGIHSGELVAGVIGKTKFAYDVWGNTVNTASRMESGGEVGKVNISETTYQLIKDFFDCTPRGAIEAKNIGFIDTYFVDRIKPPLSVNGEGKIPNETFEELKKEKFSISSH
jgi:class 3 adenylate cyclase